MTTMVANISPTLKNREESLCTLRYAVVSKEIKNTNNKNDGDAELEFEQEDKFVEKEMME